ncbi:MAG: HEAT repeat domain-containing protein [Polyangiaceae bacterium]|jgi:hypothetical protein
MGVTTVRVPRSRVRRISRLAAAALACLAMTFTNVTVSPAQDAQSAGADLAHASDFRVRVSAALLLGKTRPEGARVMLEHALDDGHAAVRTAAAAALASVGDPGAVPALERHARNESSGSARAQMETTIAALSHSGDTTAPPAPAHARYAVTIGQMKNMTGVRGGELSNVLRDAARMQAHSLPGAVVFDEGDPGTTRAMGKMPVLLLEGQITRLAQAQSSGAMRIEARVEFSVKRVPQQTLKGTLSGGATSVESMRTLSDQRLIELQNQTVGSAVESALRGADSGLALAAK